MLLSVVIPVFNEEEVLPRLFEVLPEELDKLGCDYELVFVDDGSRDGSLSFLLSRANHNPKVKVLAFSRNFGHQAAITAGMDFASGDALVVMDADLQDPPELLATMLAKFHEGYDIVSAQRISREGESWFKRATADCFYGLMKRAVDERLQAQVGDFRLFSRAAVECLKRFREQHRFMRGIVAWLGLKEAIVPFHRRARFAGTTKYPAWKMMRFAWMAISSFSALPLKLSLYGGIALIILGLTYSAYVIFENMIMKSTVPGWSSTICLILTFDGAILIAVGLIGDYVARIYEEIKGRPLYVINGMRNFAPGAGKPERAICIPRDSWEIHSQIPNRIAHENIDNPTQGPQS
jgi:dolichol-phosphate mannosyltransferase